MKHRRRSPKSVLNKLYRNDHRSSVQLNVDMFKNSNISNISNIRQPRRKKSNCNSVSKNKTYMDEKIKDILKTITTQVNAGIDLFEIKITDKQLKSFTEVIKYLLKKKIILKSDIITIRYYLCLFPTFLERLNLQSKRLETQEILYKIGM